MNNYILIFMYVLFSCIGMFLMKKATSVRTGKFIIGLFVFGASSFLWIMTLRVSPLATTFPLATGLLTITSTMVGKFSLKEDFNQIKIYGSAMIVLGMIVMEFKY